MFVLVAQFQNFLIISSLIVTVRLMYLFSIMKSFTSDTIYKLKEEEIGKSEKK